MPHLLLPRPSASSWPRPWPWQSLVKTYAVARGFVGSVHLEAMVRVLGHADIPLVVDTVIEHMRQKVHLNVQDYMTESTELWYVCNKIY